MTRLRNASLAGRQKATVPATETTRKIAQALKEGGSIYDFHEVSTETSRYLAIELKPSSKTNYSVTLKRISKPCLRVYGNRKKPHLDLHKSDSTIITELQNENPTVRRRAVQALGKLISVKET